MPCRFKIVKTGHVNFGIVPCVKTAILGPDANLEEHVPSDMLKLRKSPAVKETGRKEQLRR